MPSKCFQPGKKYVTLHPFIQFWKTTRVSSGAFHTTFWFRSTRNEEGPNHFPLVFAPNINVTLRTLLSDISNLYPLICLSLRKIYFLLTWTHITPVPCEMDMPKWQKHIYFNSSSNFKRNYENWGLLCRRVIVKFFIHNLARIPNYASSLKVITDLFSVHTRWFKYDRDWLCVNKSQFVPVIFEPPCIFFMTYTKDVCKYLMPNDRPF
jgi:hypothetical protein